KHRRLLLRRVSASFSCCHLLLQPPQPPPDRPEFQAVEWMVRWSSRAPKEKARYEQMLADALAASKLLRARYPDVKISFGNGVPATKEEFYRHKLPPRAFDFGGNEAGCFHRM